MALVAVAVVVFAGLLAALAGPNHWGSRGGTAKTAKFQIDNFKSAITDYHLAKRSMPASLQELHDIDAERNERWLSEIPNDPWDTPYEYRLLDPAKREYVIRSYGPDKKPGTDDDVEYHSIQGFRR